MGRRHGRSTCSIGIAVCPDDSTEYTDLIDAADKTMYEAKTRDATAARQRNRRSPPDPVPSEGYPAIAALL